MNFDRYLRLSSMFLVITGFYSILITNTYVVPVVIGVIIAGIYALLGEKMTAYFRVPKWVWNLAALLFLAYYIYDSFFATQDLIGNGIKFVVYLQIVKILSPKANRDWMQIFALSFLHLLASTTLSSDIAFALPFIIYVVLATWTLAMFTIKVAQEDAVRPEKKMIAVQNLLHTKDVITKPYLVATSLLSVGVIIITLIIFFTFPRLSLGHFFKRLSPNQQISGFSEQVELGTIGNIKMNDTIVFRVEMEEKTLKAVDTEVLYWRATATDHFDGRRWKQTSPERQRIRIDTDNPILESNTKIPEGAVSLEYKVFLEAINTPIIFGADRLYRVTWDKTILEKLFRGTIGVEYSSVYQSLHFLSSQNFASDLSYHGESYLGEPSTTTLKEADENYPYSIKELYLQLPEIKSEVKALLDKIPISGDTPYEKTKSIMSFLEENYRYTLDVQDAGTSNPLRFFFVERKQGHCEYFSTALIVALRYYGVPARQVVGFRGGDINLYGNYLAVRQRDAHAWTEVYFSKSGWIRFDPSPLDSTVTRQVDYFRFINQFIDYLRLRWNKYFIEYDLRSQAGIVEKLGRRISLMFRSKDGLTKVVDPNESSQLLRKIVLPAPGWLVVGGVLISLFALILIRQRKKNKMAHARYAEVLRLLARYGFQKESTETAKEFVARIERKPNSLPSLTRLTEMYYDERFGKIDLSAFDWEETFEKLKAELVAFKTKKAA